MRPGTPGFIGERLVEAREARGMSGPTLADLADVSRQSISQYEKGLQTPGPDVLRRIADHLGVPVAFFLRQVTSPENAPIFFRSMAKATKGGRTRAKRLLGWLRDMFSFADDLVELPTVNLPAFDPPSEPSRISARDIERMAQETRRHWGMGDGPIPDLIGLLETNGVILGRTHIDDDSLDGLSQWGTSRPAILVNADKCCAVRTRMDVAHELGHLILHRSVQEDRLSRKYDFALIEKQAFHFAGAFLLPGKVFAPLAYSASLNSLLDLKARWKVALKAMIVRAHTLGVISADQQRRLFIAYSQRGYHANEPLDRELEIESPKLFERAIALLVSSGGMSRESISSDIGLPVPDIERLGGLHRGFFTNQEASVSIFEPRLKAPESAVASSGARGDIIQFPGTKRLD